MNRRAGMLAGGLLWLMGGAAGGVEGQSLGPPPPVMGQAPDRNAHEPDPGVVRLQEQAAKNRNEERQKRLVADTAKLYELASELKDEVGKTNKDTLSVDVVKKAEEIEKLARSVKEKMRG